LVIISESFSYLFTIFGRQCSFEELSVVRFCSASKSGLKTLHCSMQSKKDILTSVITENVSYKPFRLPIVQKYWLHFSYLTRVFLVALKPPSFEIDKIILGLLMCQYLHLIRFSSELIWLVLVYGKINNYHYPIGCSEGFMWYRNCFHDSNIVFSSAALLYFEFCILHFLPFLTLYLKNADLVILVLDILIQILFSE
jgi:hypothetical protein